MIKFIAIFLGIYNYKCLFRFRKCSLAHCLHFRFQRELKARKNNNFAAVSVFPADFFLFKKEMSSGDYLDNFEDEEEFSDDDDDVRESKNFYNEGLGLGHVRRLEQENEVSRANSTDRELKLIGKYFSKIKL